MRTTFSFSSPSSNSSLTWNPIFAYLSGGLPHHFATTLIRSFHDEHILNAMIPYTGSAPWILRNYQECEQSIEKGLEGFSECELQEIAARLKSRKTNIKIEKDANHV